MPFGQGQYRTLYDPSRWRDAACVILYKEKGFASSHMDVLVWKNTLNHSTVGLRFVLGPTQANYCLTHHEAVDHQIERQTGCNKAVLLVPS